jgi:hypothetical protein
MINLFGNSGCKVTLVDDKTIRKQSKNIEYNERLLKQINKQINFNHPFIKTPKVFQTGFENDLLYFDMEYIPGVNLAIYFQQNSLKSCKNIIDLFSFKTENKKDIFELVMKKAKEINIDDDSLEIIKNQSWIVSDGYCHGDLTFENVIINNNEVYLIDFLDSFVDCPLVDESKMLQDAFCYWSFKQNIPKRKLISVCEKFDTKQHYSMLLLHLYRIIPYVKAEKKETILCMIQKVKTKINQF